ncbi:hypothetical protein AWB70_05341 [Caballeronia cordobensis]|uniref:Uncharacterized protein n=1 Tax=Caballeronia cordobensis TaxID=1353886 RepID=A0A158ISA9_CABCO|nr:hypothetical protein AWB70_05341 [Caballeronia cordobensis]
MIDVVAQDDLVPVLRLDHIQVDASLLAQHLHICQISLLVLEAKRVLQIIRPQPDADQMCRNAVRKQDAFDYLWRCLMLIYF